MEGEFTISARVRGCLLGGAIGDALGAPVEFMSGSAIEASFGVDGVRTFQPVEVGATGGVGAVAAVGLVTDDTQMTLFTVEGLIRATNRMNLRGLGFNNVVVHHAYLRWADTQAGAAPDPAAGWLIQQPWLQARRAPGQTCLGALVGGTKSDISFGTAAVNNSKGCGGVMRSAPYGWLSNGRNHERIYELACQGASFTHGHRTGQVASGAFALLIANLMGGVELLPAAYETLGFLEGQPDTAETIAAMSNAMELVGRGEVSRSALETLGAGWIAEEALAIALYAAICYREHDQALDALSLAVSHGGDSDSTGSICGNLLGALWGETWLPEVLAFQIEGRGTMMELADDFIYSVTRGRTPKSEMLGLPIEMLSADGLLDTKAWLQRYPAW